MSFSKKVVKRASLCTFFLLCSPHVSSTTTGIITCSIHAFIQVFLVDAAIGAVLVAATYIRQGHGRLFAVVSEA